MVNILGVSVDLTPQLVVTTVLALYAGQWVWNNYLSGVSLVGSRSEPHNDGPPLTSRSRLLEELNPLPDDLNLQEAEEETNGEISSKSGEKKNDSADAAKTKDTTNTPDGGENDNIKEKQVVRTEAHTSGGDEGATDSRQDAGSPQPEHHEQEDPSQAPEAPLPTASNPTFSNKTQNHPGLKAFWYWCDIEASLFRVYNPGRLDGQDVVPPYIPKSRRGKVRVHMKVTNKCTNRKIQVFWLDYKGNEESKGVISRGHTWMQFSWIEHPWIFRDAETGQVLLYYIPDRIIPSTALDVTTHDSDEGGDPDLGIHRFSIKDADWGSPFLIGLDDPVLPFPAEHRISTVDAAVEWTIRHMLRVTETRPGATTDWGILLQYFYNILQHPNEAKYRRIRVANRNFAAHVWNTPARGLFLAAGFVEQGAYAELGTADAFPAHRLKDISDFVMLLEQWKHQWPTLTESVTHQPEGATDGSGRAGFGVAGSNAFRHN